MHFLQFPSAFVLLWRKNDPFIMDYLWPITFVVSLSRSIWIVNMIWRMKILNNDYSLANFIINFSFSDNCFLDISSQNNNWISRGHSARSLSWSWFCLNDSFTKKVQVKVSSNVFNSPECLACHVCLRPHSLQRQENRKCIKIKLNQKLS